MILSSPSIYHITYMFILSSYQKNWEGMNFLPKIAPVPAPSYLRIALSHL
ncbi:hypothetical protein BPUM_1714 [Bacillus pumilus SAFR-032]|uniref:Uncharacterized protein n=1 Tax=Bacillus pumilus (strain SAFR-032) TaxID=315750 RepID=A8FDS5_BACP2|nr:hypothetical protein BPUM_1714 [Bacillus pumilus SAFR-032]